ANIALFELEERQRAGQQLLAQAYMCLNIVAMGDDGDRALEQFVVAVAECRTSSFAFASWSAMFAGRVCARLGFGGLLNCQSSASTNAPAAATRKTIS